MIREKKLYILYGKQAARLYSREGVDGLLSNSDSLDMQISERHFSTNEEYQAYLYGIEDSMGWEGYAIMDKKDYIQYKKGK